MSWNNLPPTTPARVRFAPSPTGHLHLGGARTALFNWLFARNRGGTFILRVEDSDLKRSRPEMVNEILKEMSWLGLDWDEGPFFQSKRGDIYRQYALRLLEAGQAYQEPSRGGEEKAIIYRVDHREEISFVDLIRGTIRVSADEIKDIVLLKSNGTPAYNFACMVDDHEMGVTQVIRGEDHIPNTPKQLILYRALGWSPPEFAHLPLILGLDKAPLSKRHGATSLKAYREKGFLPAALRNYLALLGWSPGDNREFYPTEDLIRDFSLDRVVKRAAIFDYQKLLWLNRQHIQITSPAELFTLVRPFLEKGGWENMPRERVGAVLSLLDHRLKTLQDILEQGSYFFKEEIEFDRPAVAKYWETNQTLRILKEIKAVLLAVDPFTEKELEKNLRALVARLGLKAGGLIHPLRVAVTGRADSPGIFQIIAILGKEITLARLDKAIDFLKKRESD